MTPARRVAPILLFTTSLILLAAGGLASLSAGATADAWWIAGTALGLAAALASSVTAAREHRPTVDVIALLALTGALAVREYFAGSVITVMLATGQWLEAGAAARARGELRLLLERSPRTGRRRLPDRMVEVAVDEICPGDRLAVLTGEVVPVDGRLLTPATLDESTLTGEALPRDRPVGDDIRSGTVNAGAAFDFLATACAEDSTYAGVVRLVQQAQASSAPFVRLADRLAITFVPLTLLLAGVAWAWGDAVRAVAVLVVATPCPLLIAAPIAYVSGMSRAARVGVIVKGGAALERMASSRIVLFDKTGTLTRGRPRVVATVTAPDGPTPDELLGLAASLDQMSPHVLATALVFAAGSRGLELQMPEDVHEEHGYGLRGRVGVHDVALGKFSWIVPQPAPPWAQQARKRASLEGSLTIFASVDGKPSGVFLLEDTIRPDAPRMVHGLRAAGIRRVVLVTGDRADAAETVGRLVGTDAVRAECDPAEKLIVIQAERESGVTLMVGDGINDAVALAAADVGVALASRGATAASEAANVVLTVDRIDTIADAILIAQRARRIARQAVGVGMGLSIIAMVAAVGGMLTPPVGAVLQEGIDVVAILLALRAIRPGRTHTVRLPAPDVEAGRELLADHEASLPLVEEIRGIADRVSTEHPDLEPTRRLLASLRSDLLEHEHDDQHRLVPLVARALGEPATYGLTRTHAEIEHQISRLAHVLENISDGRPSAEDVIETRRILYGLYAILRLHNAEEDEIAHSLLPASVGHADHAEK